MATLNETQLKLVLDNIIIEDQIEFNSYGYSKSGNLLGYYNNENYSIDNSAIKIDMSIDITHVESYTSRIVIHLKYMWLGDDEFNLTDFKQQQLIKEEIKKQVSLQLDI